MTDTRFQTTPPMPAAQGRPGAFFEFVVTATAGAFLVLFAVCVVGRFTFPFDLEVMEGGMADHVDRLRAGGKLYVRPGLDFTPFLYAPLYYYLSAGLTALTGDALLALRALSVACTTGTLVLVGLFVRRLGGSLRVSLLAAGLYIAAFERVLAFHDIARVDPLFVLLVLATVYTVWRRPMAWGRAVCAGVMAALAVHTKQLAVVALAPLGLWAFVLGGKGGRIFCGATVVCTLGLAAFLEWMHDGWYSYYLLEVPGGHRFVEAMWTGFWTGDILPVYGPMVLLSLIGVFLWARVRGLAARDVLFAVAVLVGVIGASYLGRLHEGGEPNTIMPLCLGAALFCALGVGAVRTLAARGGEGVRWGQGVAECLVLLQFGILAYDPGELIPSRVDRIIASRTVQDLEELEEPLFVLTESRVFAAMGRPAHAHSVAMFDVIKGTKNPHDVPTGRLLTVPREFELEFAAALDEKRYASVVYPFYSFLDNNKSYRLANVVYSPTFLGGTGMPTMVGRLQRPLFVFVARP